MPLDIKMAIDEPRERVTIELHENGEAIAHMILDAMELEQLLEALAAARANLADEVPMDIDPGTRMPALADPRWKAGHGAIPGMRVLSLRHPGLGWLNFAIPDHEAAEMAKWLGPDAPQQSSQTSD